MQSFASQYQLFVPFSLCTDPPPPSPPLTKNQRRDVCKPLKFWSAETIFLIYAKLFPFRRQLFLRGGGSVHRQRQFSRMLNAIPGLTYEYNIGMQRSETFSSTVFLSGQWSWLQFIKTSFSWFLASKVLLIFSKVKFDNKRNFWLLFNPYTPSPFPHTWIMNAHSCSLSW